ncbi:hypothetical protein K8089_11965 [Aequorivita sp. F47161]|uniref:Uncharacterized protein n=1 Tax=Aequorivita vitellina TaxID=2874475 RepID=A0A9X1QVZ6_9FLAO|nr:hypothetical protein [Aequorivita vitellina]MCG2419740.1 hypothetical protein [Aequorivita vitellina]
METEISSFWNYFSLKQKNFLFARSIDDKRTQYDIYCVLDKLVRKLHPKLYILISFNKNDTPSANLVFLTKGRSTLKKIAARLLDKAPSFSQWHFQSGITPYKHSIIALCAYNQFLGTENNIYQIYFAVKKIYKTSNKLHLLLYLEMDKQLPKSDLHDLMHIILLYFLGDAYYFKHISRYKIVRRKYSKIQFIPLDQLRHLIQFKALN